MRKVYVEAILMPNREVIHYGRTLGFVSEREHELAELDACEFSKEPTPVIRMSWGDADATEG